MKAKAIKRSLVLSILSVLVCLVMLISATFAWFTDSVSTGGNVITAGNLDIEMYARDAGGQYQPVDENTTLFDANAQWEPGHTQVAYLRIKNAGSLALKYKFIVNVKSETAGRTENGSTINLSDYLVFGTVESDTDIAQYTRAEAQAVAGSTTGIGDYSKEISLAPNAEKYVALIVYMPITVGNAANYMTGTTPPSIELGVSVIAKQDTVESDSFDNLYDLGADYPVINADDAIDAFQDDTVTNIEIADDIVVTPETDRMNITGDKVIDFAGKSFIREASTGNGIIVGEKGYDPYPVNVTFKNGNFISNTSSAAVRIESGSTVTFTDCNFSGNSNSIVQASLSDPDVKTTLVFERCNFDSGVDLDTSEYGCEYDVVFKDCTFTGTFGNGGSSVYIDSGAYGNVTLEDCDINIGYTGNAVAGVNIRCYSGSNTSKNITVNLINTDITVTKNTTSQYVNPGSPVMINDQSITTLNIEGDCTFIYDGVEKVFSDGSWVNK